MLRLDIGKHLLFVAMERLLVIGGFVQRTSQQIGPSHCQGCSLPREQRGAVAGITHQGHPTVMPGGHLDLDHGIHEHARGWADIGEELLGQPAHPCKHLAQVCQPLLAWQILPLGTLIHEKHEEFACRCFSPGTGGG